MTATAFDTALTLQGPLRQPRQMLADQSYGGHSSIHDDAMAERLGFRAGPIEGPTHFSQFVPLLTALWGEAWAARGCFSCHFLNMVVEGEAVRARVELPAGWRAGQPVPTDAVLRCLAEKADGTPVLEASAHLQPADGRAPPPSLLQQRLARLRPPGALVILGDLRVGQTGRVDEDACMPMQQPMGALYPFSLADKLAAITEPSPWYAGADNPWGRPVIPLEMVSVLAEHGSAQAGFAVKGPAVGLFADLEIRLLDGPLFVDEPYRIQRQIVALAESARTESYWVRSRILDRQGVLRAEVLLNHAVLKHSFEGYEAARSAAEAAAAAAGR